MSIFLINPSDVSFGTAVITPRWLYVLAAATPDEFGTPILIDETLDQLDFDQIQKGDVVGGVPIDSEYVVFIIDTSGSMFNYAWPMMLDTMQEILNTYPHLKGFEVTNDVGTHMFPGFQGKWITDTPAERKMVIDRLRGWNAFSASNPSQGIISAIRTYWAADKKISLYVFGDEFTGPSIDAVVKAVDMVNRPDEHGDRHVRIHAVGFPVTPQAPQYTSIRFAAMMRIICQRNDGTFVGMHEAENHGPRFQIGANEPAGDGARPALASIASESQPAY